MKSTKRHIYFKSSVFLVSVYDENSIRYLFFHLSSRLIITLFRFSDYSDYSYSSTILLNVFLYCHS